MENTDMNRRGVVFSYDALLALSIVMVVLSGVAISSGSGYEKGPQEAQLYLKSSDLSLVRYLSGVKESDSSTKQLVNCTAVLDFNSENQVSAKVRKCAT